MGFRTGSYCKVWSVEPKSATCTKIRLSVSRKDKHTGEYEQDFSGFAMCIGSAAADKAAKLKQGDRIKLGDTDVSTRYDAEKKTTYYNFKVFNFELADDGKSSEQEPTDPQPTVDEGMLDDNHDLPF